MIVSIWIVIVLCGLPFLPHVMSPFQSMGFVDEQSESAKIDRELDKKFPNNKQLLIIYHSKTILTADPAYIKAIKQSLSKMAYYPVKHHIIFPDMNPKQLSKDKHTAYVIVELDNKKTMTPTLLMQFKQAIKTPKNMTTTLGGEAIFIDSINQQTQRDLFHADIIAAPISIIILILVFGSLIAAIIPVILGAGCAIFILTILCALGHAMTLSIFTVNIALLLGLCLSLDYSLFIINRFREELKQNKSIPDAIATTLATAGRAIFFSGLAVFVSLSALFLFPINMLFSVAVGGITAVLIAVLIAIMVLPAVLGILETRINRLPIRLFKKNYHASARIWHQIAATVVKRPLLFFLTAFMLLLLCGSPFLKVHFGVADEHILPKQSESRIFFNEYQAAFNEHELTPIIMVVKSRHGNILTSEHIKQLYDMATKIQKTKHVTEVNSIVTTVPRLTLNQYQRLYHVSQHHMTPATRILLRSTTSQPFSLITIVSDENAHSPTMKTLIQQLRQIHPGTGMTTTLTGVPVHNEEVLSRIAHVFPYALTWIIVLTYVILLVLLRSLFLPLKAIIMNMLSLCATYGVLVFIFQEGHFHQLLNFEPQGMLDISLLVIIFCALFGFSMDYEVFLLTRIHESYEKTKNNEQSIIFGIEHSSQIITSAAIIVIVTCGSFMVADVLMVKEFGLGIAVAIFVDAFLVRSIFVPATMALVKQWNWYLPKWLKNKLTYNID
jgi:RND superfamily putative drug exporter